MEDPIIEDMEVKEEDEVKVGFTLQGDEAEEFIPVTGGDEEQGNSTSTNNNVIYQWSEKEIDLANKLSAEENVYVHCIKAPPREVQRTRYDNEVDMVAYLNNKENWHAVSSRMTLFTSAVLALVAMLSLLITAAEEASFQKISTWEFISQARSVSGLVRLSDGAPTASNVIFEAFLTSSAILLIFSNFGFYIMPRWETRHMILAQEGLGGEMAHQVTKHMCICRTNYKRIEATSNWVTGEEGIFKIAYNIVVGVCIKLVARVPIPPQDSPQDVYMSDVHKVVAVLSFVIFSVCELYQLFRGERIYKRRTGLIQIMRLICLIFGLIGIGGYLAFESAPAGSDEAALCVIFEWFGFVFLLCILFLYCFVPIKAEQSVFALSGDGWKKAKRRASKTD